MRVVVDPDRCEGNAICVGIAPDLFELDEQEALAEQAIAECPRAALSRRD
jgi:ferredoxin